MALLTQELTRVLELYARNGDEDQIHISDYKLQLHPVLLLHCIQCSDCFGKFCLQNSPLFRTFPCSSQKTFVSLLL